MFLLFEFFNLVLPASICYHLNFLILFCLIWFEIDPTIGFHLLHILCDQTHYYYCLQLLQRLWNWPKFTLPSESQCRVEFPHSPAGEQQGPDVSSPNDPSPSGSQCPAFEKCKNLMKGKYIPHWRNHICQILSQDVQGLYSHIADNAKNYSYIKKLWSKRKPGHQNISNPRCPGRWLCCSGHKDHLVFAISLKIGKGY